jgi:plasmid stabilization system protein ParE
MTSVIWTAEALSSFEQAIAYIAKQDPQNAALVRDRVLNTVRHLESFSLGIPGPKGYLKLYIPKTSYFVIFSRNKKDEVTLLTFVHASRDWEKIDWSKMPDDLTQN